MIADKIIKKQKIIFSDAFVAGVSLPLLLFWSMLQALRLLELPELIPVLFSIFLIRPITSTYKNSAFEYLRVQKNP